MISIKDHISYFMFVIYVYDFYEINQTDPLMQIFVYRILDD